MKLASNAKGHKKVNLRISEKYLIIFNAPSTKPALHPTQHYGSYLLSSLSAVTTRHQCPIAITTPVMAITRLTSRQATVRRATIRIYRQNTTVEAGNTTDDRRPRSSNTSQTSGWKLKSHFFVNSFLV